MAFDSTLINFLTVGDFATDPDYEVPLSQQLVTSSLFGLNLANSGAGSTFAIETVGNLLNLMTLQHDTSYGVVISVPQADGGLITRELADSSSITITNPDGASGNPSIAVNPSTTLQLTRLQVNGSNIGSPRSTLNLITGANVGISAVDSSSQFDVTISSTAATGIVSAPIITYTATSELSADQNLGLLTTGLLKNTVSAASATLSRAVPGTDYLLPNADLAAFAALTPSNGDLLYYTAGAWDLLSPGTTGQVLTVISSSSVGYTAAVSLSGSNVWTGTNTFNTNLPTSTETPTLDAELITKAYADATYTALADGPTLDGDQTWTGDNIFGEKTVFDNSIQILLGATDGYVLGSDAFGNAEWQAAGAGDVLLAGANAFTGTNTFNTALPTSTQTPTTSAQLVTKTYVDTTFNPINLSATVSTTDATPTTLATVAISSNTAVTINGILVARNTSGTINNTCGGRFTCTAVNTAGTVALAATPDVTVQSTSTATFNVVVSGTNLVVQVTGIAATAYDWSTSYTTRSL